MGKLKIYQRMNPLMDHSWSPPMRERIKQGAGQYGISATRYDFLRIAKSMMDDWQNDTCEGIYLKNIYKRSISKNDNDERWDGSDRRYGKANFGRLTRMYGGQFHLDVVGLRGRTFITNAARQSRNLSACVHACDVFATIDPMRIIDRVIIVFCIFII